MIDKDTEFDSKFSFNENVSNCFSDMISRSIPTYQLMRTLVERICINYVQNSEFFTVLDIGTSLGDSIASLVPKYKNTKFIGLENSDSMLSSCRNRFTDNENVIIKKHDIKNRIYLDSDVNIILSVLTIQFTPIEYRLNILKNLHDILQKNGILIYVEKIIGNSADIDNLFVKLYYDIKKENGYSFEEIQRKKLALEGILVPVTAKWNEELLKMSGFSEIDCFWRCLNFCGWIAIK